MLTLDVANGSVRLALLCLLQLKKEQLDKNRKITVLKNSLKKHVLFCCFKTKKTCSLKKKHLF